MNKYWVQYRYRITDYMGKLKDWETYSCFVATDDLESWWEVESSGCPHELLQVVKL